MSTVDVRIPPTFQFHSVADHPKLLLAKGMLSTGDLGLLYSLGRSFRSKGMILDLGSFCGASAYCLASGLRDAGIQPAGKKQIHCFDLFQCTNPRMQKFVNEFFYSHVGHQFELVPGNVDVDNFREVFEFQTASVRSYLKVHEGCLMNFDLGEWNGRRIEIANVDVAKTLALNEYIVKNFFPRLIHGGFVFHQDVMVPNHWYLMVNMHFLKPFVAFEFYRKSTGWLYRVVDQISQQCADESIDQIRKLRPTKMLNLMNEFLDEYPINLQANIRRSFAFGYIEQFQQAGFATMASLFAYFKIDIESSFAMSLRRLCDRLNLSY